MRETPVKLVVVALSERMKNALEMFVERSCKNEYEVGSDKGEILIADLDNYAERTQLLGFRKRHPNLPTILLSVKTTQALEESNITVLKKPLDLKLLKTTLDGLVNDGLSNEIQVSKDNNSDVSLEVIGGRRKNKEKGGKEEKRNSYSSDLSTEATIEIVEKDSDGQHILDAALTMEKYVNRSYIGSNKDIDPLDAEAIKIISFHQDNFLHGHINRLSLEANLLKDDTKTLELKTENGIFMISSDGISLKTTINDAKLRVLSIISIDWNKSTITKLNQRWEYIPGKILRTEEVLWKTSLWASRGRIPSGTNLESPVSLRFWPNMTRLLLFPHAIRIAAVWSQRPMSLIDTATYLGIPQRYVFGFFTATQAIGASYTLGSSAAASVIPTERVKNSRVFSRILKHLKKNLNKGEQKQ